MADQIGRLPGCGELGCAPRLVLAWRVRYAPDLPMHAGRLYVDRSLLSGRCELRMDGTVAVSGTVDTVRGKGKPHG